MVHKTTQEMERLNDLQCQRTLEEHYLNREKKSIESSRKTIRMERSGRCETDVG